jgi:hypothetical protein
MGPLPPTNTCAVAGPDCHSKPHGHAHSFCHCNGDPTGDSHTNAVRDLWADRHHHPADGATAATDRATAATDGAPAATDGAPAATDGATANRDACPSGQTV